MPSTLTSTINSGVTLTSGSAYSSPFTITSTGGIVTPSYTGYGILSTLVGETVVNAGVISNHSVYGNGVFLRNGSYLYNSDLIQANETGVYVSLGTVVNTGTIRNLTVNGVSVNAGASVHDGNLTNTGVITGVELGAGLGGGTLNNSGVISGQQIGADLTNATLINSGTIAGGGLSIQYGVLLDGSTLINSGTITGTADAVFVSYGGVVDIQPGAVFEGNIVARQNGGSDILEFAAGSGSFAGIGTTVTGFATINLDAGSNWTLEGSASGFNNDTISGAASNDTLVIESFSASSHSYHNGTFVLSNASASVTLFGGNDFNVTEAGGNTELTLCFCRGTHIATPAGEVAVEDLQIGDQVLTTNGVQRIRWIGHSHYDGRFVGANVKMLPVRIAAGAIAAGVPSRNLHLSPGHCLLIGGVLVPAGRLVNGLNITQSKTVEELDYYHLELARHGVVFAENCPAESFYAAEDLPPFHNEAEFAALYPEGRAPEPRCAPLVEYGYGLARIEKRILARVTTLARGFVDATRILRDDSTMRELEVNGWAQYLAPALAAQPVVVKITAGKARATVLANFARDDLAEAGIDDGRHAFRAVLRLPANAPLHRIAARVALNGQTLAHSEAGAAVLEQLANMPPRAGRHRPIAAKNSVHSRLESPEPG